MPLRVLLVEDTLLTVEQMCDLINSAHDGVALSVAATEKEAIKIAIGVVPQIVVLDLRLKQGNGFNVLRHLNTMIPKPITIVATNFALPQFREYAFLNGAEYFLDKVRDLETLPDIIESVARNLASENG